MNLFTLYERSIRRMPGTVHVRLMGGLGNQMFQYAKAVAMAAHTGRDINLDTRFLRKAWGEHTKRVFELGAFNIQARLDGWPGWALNCLPRVDESQSNQLGSGSYVENHSCFVRGYWQSEENFRSVRPELLKMFSLRQQPSSGMKTIEAEMARAKNALAIHVRRGDYVNNPKVSAVHGVCSQDYYREAVQRISSQHSVDACFVFSDDPDWIRNNFDVGISFSVIEPDACASSAEHIVLMSQCRHHVIANSSFSWWGAWLSQQNGLTMAPRYWFAGDEHAAKYIVPKAWELL